MRPRGQLLVVLAFFAFAIGSARAQDVSLEQMEEARERYSAASAAFEKGEFAAAEEGYKRSYELLRSPSMLKEIARAQEKQGKWGAAADSYAAYVREAKPDDSAAIEKQIAELRAKAAPTVETPKGVQGDLTKPAAPAEPAPTEGKKAKPWVVGVIVGVAVVVAGAAAAGAAIGVTRGQLTPTDWGTFGPDQAGAPLLIF